MGAGTSASQGICVYGDALDFDAFLGAGLLVHVDSLELVEDFGALEQLAEDGVFAVEMGCGGKGDEELRAVCVGALVGHAHDAPGVVSQGGADLVVEELRGRVVDGRRRLGLWVGCGAASLDHEAGDEAVEGAAVVEAGGAEGEEVFGRLGDRLAEELELDVAARGMQLGPRSALRRRIELGEGVHGAGPRADEEMLTVTDMGGCEGGVGGGSAWGLERGEWRVVKGGGQWLWSVY